MDGADGSIGPELQKLKVKCVISASLASYTENHWNGLRNVKVTVVFIGLALSNMAATLTHIFRS